MMSYGGGYEAYGSEEYGSGGFMDPSSQSQGTGAGGRRGGGGAGGRGGNRDSQTLLPVTIRQIRSVVRNEADDVFRIDNQEVSTVKVVGLLSNVQTHSTNVNFQLNDGTAVMEGRLFVHNEDGEYAENESFKLHDGMYVRAFGSLRSFQDKINLSCFSVSPIEDFNELSHHFLEAIYVHCYNTRGPLNNAAGIATTNASAAGQPSNYLTTAGNAGGASSSSSSMDFGMMDSSFSPEQQAILDVLGTCTSDRGFRIDELHGQLKQQMSEDKLRSVLNYLTSEGHVYSTVDENHFKRTT